MSRGLGNSCFRWGLPLFLKQVVFQQYLAKRDEAGQLDPQHLDLCPAGGGIDLGFGIAFNRLMSSARGYWSQRTDETVYLSVLFSKIR